MWQPWLRWTLLVALLLGVALSFVAAAVLAEGAMHPLRRRRPSDTAALAQSIGQAANASVKHVRIRADDGTSLNGWWLKPGSTNGGGVMVCHGVADSAFGALGFALMFLRDGYSVLVPESRGHGESGGYVTYGLLESADVVQWLTWMHTQQIAKVFGFGESLGGAILLQSLSRGANFQALAVESSYSSFERVADERIGRIVPKLAAYPLVCEALLYSYIRYGVDLRQANPEAAIAHAHIPILLIHGLADDETLPEHSRRLARANSRCTQLWLVPGGKHCGALAAAPMEFRRRVLEWFRQN